MDKITDALGKVYAQKGIVIATHCPRNGLFSCEEGDLYEIVGNLMDNACKWCESQVKVTVSFPQERHKKQSGFSLIVEDDGPGIPDNQLQAVLQRGIRADESTAGHGIGLSIVKELVQLSAGKLDFSNSELGGLQVEVFLPAPL
jgi:two-component system sensor histidine kinase PhoQ